MAICSDLTRKQSNELYLHILEDNDVPAMQKLCQEDLFFLLTIGCSRNDINRQWLYERCREVEENPNNYLDLWAREHYKSTIITYGKTIQDILCNPNITVGIFSHTRPIAKAFLEQIKRELETNEFLQDLFPDVLYREPRRESPRWSLDNGIIVKRKSNPKESTIEAWGLVDGQPTSKHFSLLIYDDVVTRESVTTSDQIKKTTDALALSYNLGADGGAKRFIGTRYHYNDTYKTIIERETAAPRVFAATKDSTATGEPVLLDKATLAKKYKDMGVYIFSAQMLQDPAADRAMGFRKEWLSFYDRIANNHCWNYYILVDPAGEKKKDSDYTVIAVIGLGQDNNYYLVDAVRDRLNLSEKTKKLFEFVRKYKPVMVGYEKYGIQADIEHIKYVMKQENYRFSIMELGGSISKNDRIRSLVPIFEAHRFWLPHNLKFVTNDGKLVDFIVEFLNDEYEAFPVSVHDDMLDCMARIVDPKLAAVFPEYQDTNYPSQTMAEDIYRTETEFNVFA